MSGNSNPGPNLILTHARSDAHQDHQTINSLNWNTFRGHQIWEHEGDLARPNLYVPLDVEDVNTEVGVLREVFASHRSRRRFDDETFRSLMRIRASNTRYAEVFIAKKIVLA